MGHKLAHYEIKDLVAIGAIDHPPMNTLDNAVHLAPAIMKKGPLAAGLELESDFWATLTATVDMKEGAWAFIQKRKPEYKGK